MSLLNLKASLILKNVGKYFQEDLHTGKDLLVWLCWFLKAAFILQQSCLIKASDLVFSWIWNFRYIKLGTIFFRKILNELSSDAPAVPRIEEEEKSEDEGAASGVSAMTVPTSLYHSSTGQYSMFAKILSDVTKHIEEQLCF